MCLYNGEEKERITVMELKLSVIVPIYNVEKYLHKCVDSLLNQDLPSEDYEIILVDDGSPDRCGEVCDEYSSRYSNIKVIYRENGGLSAARNSGIEVARGEYVQFVDPDDFLEPNVLKTLVNKMDTDKLDVLRFNYQNVNERYEVFEPNKISKPYVDYRDEACDGLSFLTERLGYACYACQFMIRRDLLENCIFKEGVYFEDTEWTPRMLLKAKRVTSTDMMVYNYLMRAGSITKSREETKKKKVLEDRLSLIDALHMQMCSATDKRWFKGMIAQITVSIIGGLSKTFYKERKAYIGLLKTKGVFPLSDYHSTKTSRRKIYIANISPLILCELLHVNNK